MEMPPMDAEPGMDMGVEDPMAGGEDMGGEMPPAPDDMGGAPDDMNGENPADGGPEGGEDDELMDIINGLSIEDKAAVTKYAKSMADGEEPAADGMMPESKSFFSKIIDETIGSLLDKKSDDGIERPGKKLNSRQRDNKTNPFVSPY